MTASPAGEVTTVRFDTAELADAARAGLGGLIARFDDPATPYTPMPRPLRAPRFNDYAHLARLKEWSIGGYAEDAVP